MGSTIERSAGSSLGRYLSLAAVLILLAGGAWIGVRFGPPAVILWLAFAALTGAILLFWESVRVALDPSAQGDETEQNPASRIADELTRLEERKQAAMRALRDIEFEHSIQRLSDEDYSVLKEKYRGEARAAMMAMDRILGEHLARAEELISQAERGEVPIEELVDTRVRKNRRKPGTAARTQTTATEQSRTCDTCGTENDADAVFCKKCGTRIAREE